MLSWLLHEIVHHLRRFAGVRLVSASGMILSRRMHEVGIPTHLVLSAHHTPRPHAFLHARAAADEPVSLERLVILDVLGELC